MQGRCKAEQGNSTDTIGSSSYFRYIRHSKEHEIELSPRGGRSGIMFPKKTQSFKPLSFGESQFAANWFVELNKERDANDWKTTTVATCKWTALTSRRISDPDAIRISVELAFLLSMRGQNSGPGVSELPSTYKQRSRDRYLQDNRTASDKKPKAFNLKQFK